MREAVNSHITVMKFEPKSQDNYHSVCVPG